MNNEWTFTEANNEEWVHETFRSKIDAISEGKKTFPNSDIVIGQLKEHSNGYKIVNMEVVK